MDNRTALADYNAKMFICPDCRKPHPYTCGWSPIDNNWLSTNDRRGGEYVEIYDLLSLHNLDDPTLSNRYVEHLARRFMALLDITGKDFCDVGSGRGYLIAEALKRNAKSITAVDIAAPSLEAVSKLGPITAVLANVNVAAGPATVPNRQRPVGVGTGVHQFAVSVGSGMTQFSM